MSKYRVGDLVKVTKAYTHKSRVGQTGTVIAVIYDRVRIRFKDGTSLPNTITFDADCLELAEEPQPGDNISYEEIKAGDRIRNTREDEFGNLSISEGVAATKGGITGNWITNDGSFVVAFDPKNVQKFTNTYTLVARNIRVLPQAIGSVIELTDSDGVRRRLFRVSETEWARVYYGKGSYANAHDAHAENMAKKYGFTVIA